MWNLSPPVALALILSGCSDGCATTPVVSHSSPDRRHYALVFERSCGATTDYSTQVSIVRESEQPTGVANTFVADTDHGVAKAGGWGGPWADVSWVSASEVAIRYAAKARIFKRAEDVDGVHIAYREVTP